MQTINLKQYYPFCKEDICVEVSDEIVEAFLLDKRAEAARERKMFRYKAFYSLDCNDGIENAAIGFPLGAMDTASKAFEAKTAIENGAAEVDMVINIGRLKNGEYDAVREDIRAVKQAVGDKVLKVIIETCLLTDDEKRKMCDIVCEAGADYIKTSTGFSTAGANFHDVELMVKGVAGRCKVKAAGGISTVEDMEKFLALGADRLGTSRAVKILNGEQAKGY
mgnify:CR=1 FL=1